MATLVAALALFLTTFIAIAPRGSAATPDLLLGRNRIGEFQGVRGADYVAWQQNTRRDPGHYDVFARPIGGGDRFKVNARGTNGANGGIQGDVLVYQEFEGGRSDLMLFDLAARDRSSPPRGVNTSQWEYWPSMSQDRLLFGRLADNGNRRIILFDLESGDAEVLDKLRGRGSFLAPGQVNGDWATWSRCPAGDDCDVIRYRISTGVEEQIPNPGRDQRASSIAPDGTVVFARARGACGTGVRLIAFPPSGPETELWRLPSGDDIGSTRIYDGGDGGQRIYYDHYACDQAAVSDVWEIVEGGGVRLTVERAGDGMGRVTGQGIDCGSDCTELYAPGTVVTLTAVPDADSSFVRWDGDCSGSLATCTVTMDDAASVTARFTRRPVLGVSTSGQGSVTSNPAGVTCGSTCSAAFDLGTQVTLTADPGPTSTFGGWGGDCSGNTPTCTLTMDGPRSVSATFTAWPVLTVTVTGQGTVSSSPSGITDCADSCEAPFAPGTLVTLTADYDQLTTALEWGGGTCSGSGQCQVTVNGSLTVTATFTGISPRNHSSPLG